MCDYSLHNVASRPANVGDELVTTEFGNAPTHGFAAIGEPNVAVCLHPGTEIAFQEGARYDHPFARLVPGFGFGDVGENVARFRRINPDSPNMHHDALEFANGQVVSVARLCLGQRATVLQLPTRKAAEHSPNEHRSADLMPQAT
jgi:hypothetical protein